MKNEGYTVSIDIPMTPELKEAIRERAKAIGLKPTAWIRTMLELVLDNILDSEKAPVSNE